MSTYCVVQLSIKKVEKTAPGWLRRPSRQKVEDNVVSLRFDTEEEAREFCRRVKLEGLINLTLVEVEP